ncbi:MAG: Cytochrome c oxidase polypeptide II [uncultured Sphingomonas sp.]|uniref:Cytochrome c oxidase subunit 2 n=1 Tax=uncultured Sphingomonas sp. TaxID=158754 RepID=A0A6J4TE71_9SPHN|nr:cytochrome c oxidase subunit II [uncultured Sphingomonas sp.]CAA9520292.1 MAG: Cytochrome c oxidase polypeptide II [uncultured Sphingomonas sp.]
MRRIGWLLALAAAGLTPAAAQTPPEVGAQASEASATTTTAAPAQTLPAPAPGAVVDPTPGPSAVAPAAPAAPTVAAPAFQHAAPVAGIGMPDGRLGTQDQFTPIGREGAAFHNNWLLLLCAAISLFVLGLLTYAIVRYRRSAHPVPSRTSHNTFVEVMWTLVPVLILVAIAIPSIRLIRHQYSPPPADLTVKVIGNQWYWTYQYPDNGGFEIVSNMLKERNEVAAGARFRTDRDGPRLLAADERLVIPAGQTVKFIVTSNDVIHSFAVPAFWTKIDANPGILNETWVRVDKPGVYFGQCSELCGARHAYMPIAVEAVTPQRFAQWVASKGGTLPGARPAPAPDSTAATTVTPKNVTPAPAPTPATGNPTGAPPAAAGNGQPGVAQRATDGSSN